MDLSEWQAWWKARGRVELNRLLVEQWNPIGYWVPEDEYTSYSGPLARMLREEASEAEIAEYLGRVRTVQIEAKPDPGDDARAAAVVVAWYAREMTPSR